MTEKVCVGSRGNRLKEKNGQKNAASYLTESCPCVEYDKSPYTEKKFI